MKFDFFERRLVASELLSPKLSRESDQFREVVHESVRNLARVQKNTQRFEA